MSVCISILHFCNSFLHLTFYSNRIQMCTKVDGVKLGTIHLISLSTRTQLPNEVRMEMAFSLSPFKLHFTAG